MANTSAYVALVAVMGASITITDSRTVKSHLKLHCRAGTYLNRDIVTGSENCSPCKSGFYMDIGSHRIQECKLCDRPHPGKRKKVIKECTATSNVEMGCKDGFYRLPRGHNFICRKCRDCTAFGLAEKLPCAKYRDAVCDILQKTSTTAVTSTVLLSKSTTQNTVSHTEFTPESQTATATAGPNPIPTTPKDAVNCYTFLDLIVVAIASFIITLFFVAMILLLMKKEMIKFPCNENKNVHRPEIQFETVRQEH